MFDSYFRTPQQAAVPRAQPARLPTRAVLRAIEYMHANLAESVRLEDIAGAAGLSIFHFSRTFRHATGVAPHRYLVEARIVRVKTLLLESEESLASIAEEAGFSDQSHMSKVFRRLAGTTPKQFRDGVGGGNTPPARPGNAHSTNSGMKKGNVHDSASRICVERSRGAGHPSCAFS